MSYYTVLERKRQCVLVKISKEMKCIFWFAKVQLSENGVTKFLRRRDEKEKNRSPKPKI